MGALFVDATVVVPQSIFELSEEPNQIGVMDMGNRLLEIADP